MLERLVAESGLKKSILVLAILPGLVRTGRGLKRTVAPLYDCHCLM